MRLFRFFIALLLPAALILCWHWAVSSGALPHVLFPLPLEVLDRLGALTASGELPTHIAASFQRLFAGFFLGAMLGGGLGLVTGYCRWMQLAVEPMLLALIPIPPFVWTPLLIVIFGLGDGSKIALIAIGSFFCLFGTMADAVRRVDLRFMELARTLEKSTLTVFMRILLPHSLAALFSSLRMALALSWTLLMAGEMIASSNGLGWLIWDSRNFSRADDMVAGMVTVAILGKLSDVFLAWLGSRLIHSAPTLGDAAYD